MDMFGRRSIYGCLCFRALTTGLTWAAYVVIRAEEGEDPGGRGAVGNPDVSRTPVMKPEKAKRQLERMLLSVTPVSVLMLLGEVFREMGRGAGARLGCDRRHLQGRRVELDGVGLGPGRPPAQAPRALSPVAGQALPSSTPSQNDLRTTLR